VKESAVDRAYTWVRKRILDGTLPGGSFVDEATVCEATGVSRTPAREAFNRLDGERFVTRIPNRGVQVREVNSADLYEAFHARFMIESFAATEFCSSVRSVPPEMLTHLAAMDEPHDFASIEGITSYFDADRAFHAALVRTLNNRPIVDFFESLWRLNTWGTLNRGQMLRSETWLANNRAQHHAIATALGAHDLGAAADALREHLKLSFADFSSMPA
jgi:DNA-binding GntR family transcriptional regulator